MVAQAAGCRRCDVFDGNASQRFACGVPVTETSGTCVRQHTWSAQTAFLGAPCPLDAAVLSVLHLIPEAVEAADTAMLAAWHTLVGGGIADGPNPTPNRAPVPAI